MTARITRINGQIVLIIEASLPTGLVILHTAAIDLTSKRRTRLEIDWAHEKTGYPRPDLYDAVRAYQWREKERTTAA